MMRKIIAVIVGVILIIAGSMLYITIYNRPEAVMKRFTHDLATAGNSEKTYGLLSSGLTKGREDYWHNYLAQFKSAEMPPILLSQERITDTFNTYTDQNDPRRFVYAFKMKNKTYNLTIILVKHAKFWKVDELHGDYAP